MRILLAEDSLINQRLAIRLLEKQGYQVTLANNGREAVDAFERERFDLVLMDIQMPEMSGFEATSSIRERERMTGAHIPIIAVTAYAMQGGWEEWLKAGMDGYLPKPIQAAELFRLIEVLAPIRPIAPIANESPGGSMLEALDRGGQIGRWPEGGSRSE